MVPILATVAEHELNKSEEKGNYDEMFEIYIFIIIHFIFRSKMRKMKVAEKNIILHS